MEGAHCVLLDIGRSCTSYAADVGYLLSARGHHMSHFVCERDAGRSRHFGHFHMNWQPRD